MSNNREHIDAFERSIGQTNHWLDKLKERYHFTDRQQAYNVLRAVLHTLRDRLPYQGLGSLSGQMPVFLRGVLFEGWAPGREPEKLKPKEFFESVAKHITINRNFDGLTATRAVFWLLQEEMGVETVAHILHFLPVDFRRVIEAGIPSETSISQL